MTNSNFIDRQKMVFPKNPEIPSFSKKLEKQFEKQSQKNGFSRKPEIPGFSKKLYKQFEKQSQTRP